MHTFGLAVLQYINTDIVEDILNEGRKDDNHGLELDGVDLEIVTLSGMQFLKVRQSPVIAVLNEHHDFGLHYISPHDTLISTFDTTINESNESNESNEYGYSLPLTWWK